MNKGIYDVIFERYKQFILDNSKYSPRVVKYSSRESADFPLTTCELKNDIDTNIQTQKKIDKSKKFYFTINHYARDKVINKKTIASQIMINELVDLTNTFFGDMLNMRCTLDTPTPNLDTEILRQTQQYQCEIDNRGNIYNR